MKDEGRFSKVTRRMWNDAKFRSLSAAKPNAQTLWLRLLTGPELGPIPGLFAARAPALADVLGWSLAAFRKCWKEIESAGLALADWRAGLIWVPNALKHNEPQGVTTVVGWRVAMRELPECELKSKAADVILAYLRGKAPAWVRAWTDSSDLPDDVPNDEPEGLNPEDQAASKKQEQEQERREDPPPPVRPKPADPFMATLTGRRTQDDPGVIAVFEAWKLAHGSVNSKFRQPADSRADVLFEAVTTHGVEDCLRVLEASKTDAMVTGKADERGQSHTSVEYIFKPTTFDRLLREADKHQASKPLGAAEVMRRARLA